MYSFVPVIGRIPVSAISLALLALFGGHNGVAAANSELITAQASPQSTLSDDEIRNRLIRQSIANYPGTCACPYDRARNGSKCGRRSAYSRPGGYAPLCYRNDVSDEMIRRYRFRQNER